LGFHLNPPFLQGRAFHFTYIETPGALSEPGSFLRRPLRTADPIGPFRKNQS